MPPLPKFRFIPESARIAYRKKAAASSVATGDNVMLKESQKTGVLVNKITDHYARALCLRLQDRCIFRCPHPGLSFVRVKDTLVVV